MQVILGAGGDIGSLLARELKNYTGKVRLVARNPTRESADDELVQADLTDREAVFNAVEGATVAYLVAGLPYDRRIWKTRWPVIMQNCIDACIRHKCRLVFFDNVYMYSKAALANMTEESPVDPPSEKGKVRAALVHMIFKAIRERGLTALIARSADFYGPGAKNGILNMLVIDNLKKGGRANWQSDVNRIHSFTYTPDAAKGTAILGNTEAAYNQVWHLPTSSERLTGKQFITLTAQMISKKPVYFVLGPFMISVAGIFSRKIKELGEMQYQNDRDYFFSSEKFNKRFGFVPVSYAEGIRQSLAVGAAR